MRGPCLRSRLAIQLIWRVQRYGYAHWAPSCASWVFLSRGSTGRSSRCPEGNLENEKVLEANCQVVRRAGHTSARQVMGKSQGSAMHAHVRLRTVLLIMISKLNDITWTLEQPSSSLLNHFWPFQALVRNMDVYKVFFWMGWYGSPSAKPTHLWSNRAWVATLGMEGKPHVSSEGLDIAGSPAHLGRQTCRAWMEYPTR
jgi:hypothetical protein